ncbi:60S ribosomal protein L7a [Sciurus carolinensis]|uniref:60S ribosomal protein L7a n=1 Tax=Sciurus carolinensis TaxID=30640 RepID=A0AA41NDX9_SCICA|nr:60S ribosomal protein L7a [Sciurus carolinensis]
MSKGKKTKGKKLAQAPAAFKKQGAKKVVNPLFEKRPKNFSIGQDMQPNRDLTRFVKWPRYIGLQRQRGYSLQAAESASCDYPVRPGLGAPATQLRKLAHKYRPEQQEKKQRLLARDEKRLLAKGMSP